MICYICTIIYTNNISEHSNIFRTLGSMRKFEFSSIENLNVQKSEHNECSTFLAPDSQGLTSKIHLSAVTVSVHILVYTTICSLQIPLKCIFLDCLSIRIILILETSEMRLKVGVGCLKA